MTIKGYPAFPKHQHYWNLTIRLFCVLSQALVEWGVSTLCRGSVGVFYRPCQLGNLNVMYFLIYIYIYIYIGQFNLSIYFSFLLFSLFLPFLYLFPITYQIIWSNYLWIFRKSIFYATRLHIWGTQGGLRTPQPKPPYQCILNTCFLSWKKKIPNEGWIHSSE